MNKKPVHRAIRLENILFEIHDAEQILLKVEASAEFQALKPRQKLRYHDVLGGLRTLIYDLEQDTAQEQLAS